MVALACAADLSDRFLDPIIYSVVSAQSPSAKGDLETPAVPVSLR
jgi:hypothetical protein